MARMTPDWRRVHDEFPVNQHLVWLNNCGTTPTPGPVLAALQAHHRAYAERGVLGVAGEWAVHASVCARLGRLLGCAPDELALVHHTAEAMTFVSHGLALAPGERILLLENEYPSNVYPWEHWRERGVALDVAPLGASPDEFVAGFRAALQPGTRVACLSAVHWCTGMPLPLDDVAALCAERGVLLVLDAAQGAGLVPLDLHALGVACAAFSAWKWLLGPLGLGVLYVRRDLLDRLRFPFKGTGSVVDDEIYLPYRAALKPTTARYVLSTPNFSDWIYFDASLAYLEALGWDAVMRRIDTLADALADGLRALGFTLARDGFGGRGTGIVAADHPRRDAAALAAGLGRAGVVVAERLGRLRLAPHVYLSETQIAGTLAKIAALLSS
jgi:selenocysteine lyase/cysteine desulfurase